MILPFLPGGPRPGQGRRAAERGDQVRGDDLVYIPRGSIVALVPDEPSRCSPDTEIEPGIRT